MTAMPDDVTTPSAAATPRRTAVRTLGAASAVLLGAVGRGGIAGPRGKARAVGAEKKKRSCKCQLIGLTSAESDPFSLAAGTGATRKALCPDGFIAISGGLQGESEVTAPCMIRESHPEPDGSAWVVNVFCTEATNTDLRVGVVCFSRRSFQLQG
jgi:hypothetical protein